MRTTLGGQRPAFHQRTRSSLCILLAAVFSYPRHAPYRALTIDRQRKAQMASPAANSSRTPCGLARARWPHRSPGEQNRRCPPQSGHRRPTGELHDMGAAPGRLQPRALPSASMPAPLRAEICSPGSTHPSCPGEHTPRRVFPRLIRASPPNSALQLTRLGLSMSRSPSPFGILGVSARPNPAAPRS